LGSPEEPPAPIQASVKPPEGGPSGKVRRTPGAAAARAADLPKFLDDNALYPASERRDISHITVSIAGTNRFSFSGEELTPHEFVLNDNIVSEWLSDGVPRPLVLDIVNPGTTATALAQRLSDVTGSEIIVPKADAPSQWQILRPIFSAREHVAGTVKFSEAGNLVLVRGTEREIRPEEHLGQVAGVGATETAFRLYDKTVVVYRRRTDPEIAAASDAMDAQIEATQFLVDRGAPHVARIHGATQVYGLDALIMDSFRSSTRSIESSYATFGDMVFYGARDVSLLNDNSLTSLREMREFYVRENIGVDAVQFFIADDGSFALHGFSKVYDFSTLDEYAYLDDPSIPMSNSGFIHTIDHWIDFVETVIQRRSGLGADQLGRIAFRRHIAPYFGEHPEEAFADMYFAGYLGPKLKIETWRPASGEDIPMLSFNGPLRNPETGEIIATTFHSEIWPTEGKAHLIGLTFTEPNRGAGLGKTLVAGQIEAYRRMGLQRVELNGGLIVGGYAWARYGWLPASVQEWFVLSNKIRARMWAMSQENGDPTFGRISAADKRTIEEILDRGDPRDIWAISDLQVPTGVNDSRGMPMTLGKALLLGHFWRGSLHLDNPEQMERFYDYVGGRNGKIRLQDVRRAVEIHGIPVVQAVRLYGLQPSDL
jgi:hypothetical protein